MSTVPNKKVERIGYYEDREDLWETNAVPMGSSTTTVADWKAKVAAARAKYQAFKIASDTAKSLYIEFMTSYDAMSTSGASIIDQVRAKAKIDGNDIYALANVAAPAPYTPKGPPGAPNEFKAALGGNGAVELSWKCKNPPGTSGTMYQIYRRTSDVGPFTFLGGSGSRKFIDNSLPAGTTVITYMIQAMRSTSVGPWVQFNVNFGLVNGGPASVAVSEGKMVTSPKIAA